MGGHIQIDNALYFIPVHTRISHWLPPLLIDNSLWCTQIYDVVKYITMHALSTPPEYTLYCSIVNGIFVMTTL